MLFVAEEAPEEVVDKLIDLRVLARFVGPKSCLELVICPLGITQTLCYLLDKILDALFFLHFWC